ncbi:hypothetical protein QQS21_002693 [Conoideocrella luteorostrata]|uniref:Rhodopsin domain-containing protein n=1 Tax=Conoideocrella luteorostrata TaxID=1105319 RepID=A0AAJ0G135_9HYPO|nr:hypothetical protein QQS21_002693 [Conoideocrella luteorostrata]
MDATSSFLDDNTSFSSYRGEVSESKDKETTFWNWLVVGFGLVMFVQGVGYHADDVGHEGIVSIRRWLTITELIYVWNLCWTKLSLLVMYYRVFHFPYFKKLTVGVGCFVITWAICITFLFTFICMPVEKLWRPELPGRCVSELGVWLANAGATIFSDVVILLLPIPQVWNLQLKKFEKVGLTIIFGLGFFAVFASSFRTWVLFNYSKYDIPYTLTPLLAWSQIEMSAGIISACLPTMRPITRLASHKLGLDKAFRLSGVPKSGSGTNNQVGSGSNIERSNPAAPSFVTPQTLRVTAESTNHSDWVKVLKKNRYDANSRRRGILVETSLEWELELDQQIGLDGHLTEVERQQRRSEQLYKEKSSIDMDWASAMTDKSDLPMKRMNM